MHARMRAHTLRAHTHSRAHVYTPAGARARNVLLVGANEATCTVARQAAVACFVDGASPKQSGKQNGFGTQVVTKWWYAMVLSQAGFHLLFSDPDIVWLKDPFQHWDRSFDFQVRAPTLPVPLPQPSPNPNPNPNPDPSPDPNRSFDQGLSDIRSTNVTTQRHHEITCLRPWMENMYEHGPTLTLNLTLTLTLTLTLALTLTRTLTLTLTRYEHGRRSVYPCQSTGLWYARSTPPTHAFLEGLHGYLRMR